MSPALLQVKLDLWNLQVYFNGDKPLSHANFLKASELLESCWSRWQQLEREEGEVQYEFRATQASQPGATSEYANGGQLSETGRDGTDD